MRLFKILSLGLVPFLAVVYFNYFSSYVFPWQEKDAIQTTLNWGGLNPIPKNAENIEIQKDGSLLSRSFIIKFSSNKSDIETWVKSSKRLKLNVPKIKNGKEKYEIYPGENESIGGTVEIEGETVKIKMSWS